MGDRDSAYVTYFCLRVGDKPQPLNQEGSCVDEGTCESPYGLHGASGTTQPEEPLKSCPAGSNYSLPKIVLLATHQEPPINKQALPGHLEYIPCPMRWNARQDLVRTKSEKRRRAIEREIGGEREREREREREHPLIFQNTLSRDRYLEKNKKEHPPGLF